MHSRRAFLAGLTGAVLGAAGARAGTATGAPPPPVPLRVLRLRGRTLLVDIGGRRVLIDPCFAPDLGAAVLWDAAAPTVGPEEVGALDLLLVSAREPGAFDGAATARLQGRDTSCFVPDEETAQILRHQGYRRVRVVTAGDTFTTRGVTVAMSPSRALFGGPAVGFRLERSGRTFWHAGAPPPLDDSDGPARFARALPSELIAASSQGLTLAGTERTIDREDALLLAGLAHSRYAILLGDDVRPSALGGLVLKANPGAWRLPPGVHVRAVVVEEGRWYRVLPASAG